MRKCMNYTRLTWPFSTLKTCQCSIYYIILCGTLPFFSCELYKQLQNNTQLQLWDIRLTIQNISDVNDFADFKSDLLTGQIHQRNKMAGKTHLCGTVPKYLCFVVLLKWDTEVQHRRWRVGRKSNIILSDSDCVHIQEAKHVFQAWEFCDRDLSRVDLSSESPFTLKWQFSNECIRKSIWYVLEKCKRSLTNTTNFHIPHEPVS